MRKRESLFSDLREVVPGSSAIDVLFVAEELVGQVVDLFGVLASLLDITQRASILDRIWTPSVLAELIVGVLVVSDSLALDVSSRPDIVLPV